MHTHHRDWWNAKVLPSNKIASMIVLVIGVGLLVVSVLADVIGIGDDPGFGHQQTVGTIAGAVVTAIGLFLAVRATR